MGLPLCLLALPSSLLLLLASSATAASSENLPWPYNLPRDAKYFPEDEALIRRDIDVQQKLQTQPVAGVRKMSADPGEKFFLDYWSFENEDAMRWTNQSLFSTFDPCYPIHGEQTEYSAILPRFLKLRTPPTFFKRDFQCPAGTSSCTSIDRPDSCCSSGSTCQLVQDSGLGDVGCCPAGQTCAGSLSACPSGYSSCPNNPGGGCCLPGYQCFDVGCVLASTATIFTQPSPTPSTSTQIPPDASTTTVTLTTIVTPTQGLPSTLVVTVTTIRTSIPVQPVPPPTTSTTTVTSTTRLTSTRATSLTCASDFRSCPLSLGGGCCHTDRLCGSANCPASTTSTSAGSLVAPNRPTTEVTTTTTAASTSPTSVIGCPTGFYACSAYYQGGCCQIGRDCGMTSCPTSASTTLVNTNSITAVAPTGSGITAPGTLLTGACAQGWSTCAADAGGGCCPSGYACGTSCTATASGAGGRQVGKMAPNGGSPTVPMNRVFCWITVCLSSVLLGIGVGL